MQAPERRWSTLPLAELLAGPLPARAHDPMRRTWACSHRSPAGTLARRTAPWGSLTVIHRATLLTGRWRELEGRTLFLEESSPLSASARSSLDRVGLWGLRLSRLRSTWPRSFSCVSNYYRPRCWTRGE